MAARKTSNNLPANRQTAGKRRGGKRRTSWKPGQSGNPAGSPKRGESWVDIIKWAGDLTAADVQTVSPKLARKLKSLGNGVTLKQAAVLKAYGDLATGTKSEARLLNTLMDRAEGKISQPVTVEPSTALFAKLQELGLTLNDVRSDPLAVELFRLAGVAITGTPEVGTDRSEENNGLQAGA